MAKTQAERARDYRARKRDGVTDENVTKPERDGQSVTECDHPSDMVCGECDTTMAAVHEAINPIGPLDVYSEQRWSFLQSRGHVWDADRQCSVRPDGVIGVTVPGDSGYRGEV